MSNLKVSTATLIQGPSLTIVAITMLLEGLKVAVSIDGGIYEGVVTQIEMAPGCGSDHLYANVRVPDLDESSDDDYASIRVAITANGQVTVLPKGSD
ncbi:MAG: hypothetical protein WC052_02065 [Patescibacteria group bacterium]|jgi:hypothetical protein